jgi:hypothetical protein
MYQINRVLSNEDIFRVAPSVMATQPWKDVSSKYTFIPTIGIVDALRNEGFMPVSAAQSSTRIEGKKEFTKHMLRFRRAEDLVTKGREVGTEIPELVLVNSHDRSSGYQLSAGLFRLVCRNGMVVKSSTLGDISVRHSGDIAHDVIEGSYTIIDEMPKVLEQVDQFKGIALRPEQQLAFASAALELRYPHDEDQASRSPIIPEQLLNVRRYDDRANDLWTTFNRVQENFMRGGLRGIGTTGRRLRTRKIASINEDLRLNKSLWMLTEKMAELAK